MSSSASTSSATSSGFARRPNRLTQTKVARNLESCFAFALVVATWSGLAARRAYAMATTLATQLAELAAHNPNAGRLHSAKSLKSRESYLFTPRQAAVQSLDDVHALGIEGLEGLLQLNPGFEQYRASLFGEGARRLDRTLLAKEEVGRLDETLGRFLMDVGPHILVKPSANALEWLIRRFR